MTSETITQVYLQHGEGIGPFLTTLVEHKVDGTDTLTKTGYKVRYANTWRRVWHSPQAWLGDPYIRFSGDRIKVQFASVRA